ncbi:MAG: metallophosphoesterase [Solirubrobacterales bacterium]
MRTAVISDTHIGAHSGRDLLRSPEIQSRLGDVVGGCDRLVLLGDTIELRDGPIEDAIADASPFLEWIAEAFAGKEVVLVPGNHDHRLLGPWIDRRREQGDVALDELVSPPHPQVERIAEALGDARLEVRYPGVWIRDDVYATHGHYADSHVTLPTVERLSVAMVDRLGGEESGKRLGPHDYETVHAPVYDLIFNLAQGVRASSHDTEGRATSMRIWELMGGASGQARTVRGKLLSSAVVPATLRVLESVGLGRFGRDFSLAEIGRSGVDAMHTVADRLEIGADHVIFGHIHRRGPLPGEDGRSATDPEWERRGRRLYNTGCWLWVDPMLRRTDSRNPFWPGRVLLVGDEGEPEAIEVLEGMSAEEIARVVGG